ncbi:Receptor-like protein kinase HAIKU2 [Morella rubra]|uniref:Receptor-like protein kinase HAIKU2 n=1 Tax=Morella rubra TaxID=262757 RepID=A0A6A1WDH7_9ROSI|nr:Receptor-like protein kinase HAIKU2 [Morella rubra]
METVSAGGSESWKCRERGGAGNVGERKRSLVSVENEVLLNNVESQHSRILRRQFGLRQIWEKNLGSLWFFAIKETRVGLFSNTGLPVPGLIGAGAEIELLNQNLYGILPLYSICELQSLAKLSLGFNLLRGPVMEDLKNCAKLEYLDLGNNFFSGAVPDISSLSQLRYLHLNHSGFSGNFPWKSLQNMTGLVRLSLGDNPFNPSPIPTEVVQLTKLDWLYLSNCNIQGTIPTGIGSLTGLIDLELADNNMPGEISAEIGNLINL